MKYASLLLVASATKHCCDTLSIFILLSEKLLFNCDNGHANAPQCYVNRTLSIFLCVLRSRNGADGSCWPRPQGQTK